MDAVPSLARASRQVWHPVPPAKIGSWLLLMIISCVMVPALYRRGLRSRSRLG